MSFGEAEEPEIKLPTLIGSSRKQGLFRKTSSSFFFTDCASFDCVDYNKIWKISTEMGLPDPPYLSPENLICRSRCKSRISHGTIDWFKIGKDVCHPAYLTYAEYIMLNAGLDESQAGIKIAWRIINNLRYADDTTLMAEREEELEIFQVHITLLLTIKTMNNSVH